MKIPSPFRRGLGRGNNKNDRPTIIRIRAKRFMNLKFRRQHVIKPYIVDFYCHEIGLVIELDGSQHGTDDAIEYDAERSNFLETLDLSVVRYWNHDALSTNVIAYE